MSAAAFLLTNDRTGVCLRLAEGERVSYYLADLSGGEYGFL